MGVVKLIVSEPTTLTAGNANSFCFASLYNASNYSPNKTPLRYFDIITFCVHE